jgi:hypothetical protein
VLHQIRDPAVSLDGDLGHGNLLGTKGAVYPRKL